MSRVVRIGVAQHGSPADDAERSRELSLSALRAALESGSQMVILPELAVPGYTTDKALLDRAAEKLDGPSVSAWSGLARESGAVIVGGFCEVTDAGLANAVVTVGPEGVLSHYRKLHLFAGEKQVFVRGDLGLPVVDTPAGRVGVCVCYDLRFPEVARLMALRGAEIIAVPTAWLPGFDTQRWDADGMCPQAHGAVLQANLDQVIIACASAAGAHGGLEFLGSSIVVDPHGRRVLGPLSGREATVAHVDVDLDEVERAQHRGPGIDPRLDRRTDVYQITYAGDPL